MKPLRIDKRSALQKLKAKTNRVGQPVTNKGKGEALIKMLRARGVVVRKDRDS